jgi:hypothetical protein
MSFRSTFHLMQPTADEEKYLGEVRPLGSEFLNHLNERFGGVRYFSRRGRRQRELRPSSLLHDILQCRYGAMPPMTASKLSEGLEIMAERRGYSWRQLLATPSDHRWDHWFVNVDANLPAVGLDPTLGSLYRPYGDENPFLFAKQRLWMWDELFVRLRLPETFRVFQAAAPNAPPGWTWSLTAADAIQRRVMSEWLDRIVISVGEVSKQSLLRIRTTPAIHPELILDPLSVTMKLTKEMSWDFRQVA